MIERPLRFAAILIAVVAFIDPPVRISGRSRPRLAVIVESGPRAVEASAVSETLRRDLKSDFLVVAGFERGVAATVVIGDRYPDVSLPEAARISTVTLEGPPSSVRIARVSAPRAVPPATALRIGVDIRAIRKKGTATALVARAAGSEAGRADHTWSSDDETWKAVLEVIPVGRPPYAFVVSVEDERAVVMVDGAPALRVLVLEARPSWAAAFVRRALENDPRFEVSALSDVAPRAVVASGPSPELPSEPGSVDVIVAGGLDRLSAANLAMLDRFARDRGGAILLLPDARVPAAVSERLMPGAVLKETLLERSSALVPEPPITSLTIDASEMLEAESIPAGTRVIARSSSSRRPVVWSSPHGDGVVVASGAMDAWRYRGAERATFDRFWQSVVAGLALAAQPPVAITLSPARARVGERVRVAARVRLLEREQLKDRLSIAAAVGGKPIRLWPDAESGVFTGSFFVESQDQTVVTASVTSAATGRARLTVDDKKTSSDTALPLELLARTHQGVNVGPARLVELERHLRETIPADRVPISSHPMRSAWWFAPFVSCLSAEWWLRRRRGAR